MNRKQQKQLVTLRQSIKVWEDAHVWLKNGFRVVHNFINCSCCLKYYGDHCTGCPIYEESGWTECYNTPYTGWRRYPSMRNHRKMITWMKRLYRKLEKRYG